MTFFSHILSFFKVKRFSKPSVRLSLSQPVVILCEEYSELTFYLKDISETGFMVCVQGNENLVKNFFLELQKSHKSLTFVFLLESKNYGNLREINEVVIKARNVNIYNNTCLGFKVDKKSLRDFAKVYEYFINLELQILKDQSTCQNVENLANLLNVPVPLNNLLYVFLQERKENIREKRLKLAFYIFIFAIFLFGGSILPLIISNLETSRLKSLVKQYETKHNTKILYLIHQKKSFGFFGLPIYEYLEVHDAHKLLEDLSKYPPEKNVTIIIHSPGGQLLAGIQIARMLKNRTGNVTIVVPYYAMSAGTLIALSGTEIIANPEATFGPIDPQVPLIGISNKDGPTLASAVFVTKAYNRLSANKDKLDLSSEINYLMSETALKQMEDFLFNFLLKDKKEEDRLKIINTLLYTQRTHDFPVFVDELKSLGFNVKIGLPEDLNEIVKLIINNKAALTR